MPFCPRCGRGVVEEGDYCTHCRQAEGAERSYTDYEPRECPKCHGTGLVSHRECQGSGQLKVLWQTDSSTGEKLYRWVKCPDCRAGQVRCDHPGCNLGYIS